MDRDRKVDHKIHILGIGFDNQDGHKRLTVADDFSVIGGSEETHSRMTETLIRTAEDLNRRGKKIQDTHAEELKDLLFKNSDR